MADTVVILQITPGTPRVGLWCDTCLFPARYEVPLHTLNTHGVSTIGTVRRCRRCDDGA